MRQLPLILRFVDVAGTICEEFVDFVLCDTGTTGTAIAGKILGTLETYGLNLGYLRGQGYDGAGNMAGKYRGAAATIQSKCPKAVYVHCAARACHNYVPHCYIIYSNKTVSRVCERAKSFSTKVGQRYMSCVQRSK